VAISSNELALWHVNLLKTTADDDDECRSRSISHQRLGIFHIRDNSFSPNCCQECYAKINICRYFPCTVRYLTKCLADVLILQFDSTFQLKLYVWCYVHVTINYYSCYYCYCCYCCCNSCYTVTCSMER